MGEINYDGEPSGRCHFATGAGEIALMLPSDLNAALDLQANAGGVDVDFDVDGRVTRTRVKGTVGSGGDTEITAQAGVGSIDVQAR
jgi:hypothetical protein